MAVCIRVLKCVFPLAEQVAPFTVGVMSTAASQVILFILSYYDKFYCADNLVYILENKLFPAEKLEWNFCSF